MKYFLYDALMHPENMNKVCPDSNPMSPFTLKNHEIAFLQGDAALFQYPGKYVHGVVYDLPEDDAEILEEYYDYHEDGYGTYVKVTFGYGDGAICCLTPNVTKLVPAPPHIQYFLEMKRAYEFWKLDSLPLELAVAEALDNQQDSYKSFLKPARLIQDFSPISDVRH